MRKNLMSVMKSLGALLAFTARFSIFMLGSRQNFSMATNFMSKIYSVHDDEAEEKDDAIKRNKHVSI